MRFINKKIIKETIKKQPLVCLTAYTKPIAELVYSFADIILVGDSLGPVLYGFESTRKVTLEMMINHGKAVCENSSNTNVVIDLPYGTYECSEKMAYENASKLINETGACGVKLEGGKKVAPIIEYLVKRNIYVMAHIGMLPQSANNQDDYKVFGRSSDDNKKIFEDLVFVEEAGAFSVVIEATTNKLASQVAKMATIPTIGIGASIDCSGQILVTEDLIGMTDFNAKFIKKYSNVRKDIGLALKKYRKDVKSKKFPSMKFCYK